MRFEIRPTFPYLALTAAVLVLYGDVVSFGYIWDDHLLISFDFEDALRASFESFHLRPVWYFSYVASRLIYPSPIFDHAVNLLLFLVATFLGFRFASRYTGQPAALLTVLVWISLPWNVYPVAWVAQRSDPLIFVFGFLALLALRARNPWWSVGCLTLAVFSKITVAFLPLYFGCKFFLRGQRGAAAASLGLMGFYLIFAVGNYLRYFKPAGHLEDVSPHIALLRFPVHWLEHFLTLAVPMPFFTGIFHGLTYFVFLTALLFGVKSDRSADMVETGELVLIGLLVSIPTAFTPQLRICGFESFFWVLLAVRTLRISRRPVFCLALAALLCFNTIGIFETKKIFRNTEEASERRIGLYPNDYYDKRAELVRHVAQSILGR